MSFPTPTTGIGVPATVLVNFGQILSVTVPVLLNIGGTFQISPTLIDVAGNVIAPTGSFSYSSANAGIASVNSSGLITANALGNVSIQVTYAGTQYALVSVNVIQGTLPSEPVARQLAGNFPAKYVVLPDTLPGAVVTSPFELCQ
jgi:Bacterial Ig-like domain (group 2)